MVFLFYIEDKRMKKFYFLIGCIIILFHSCTGKTCTSAYLGTVRIEGQQNSKVFIKYIGPEKSDYGSFVNFGFTQTEYTFPFNHSFMLETFCDAKDFKNHNHNFLYIKNTSEEDIIICAVLSGAEIDEHPEETYYRNLLDIYNKQDKDPNYDYTKDKHFTGIEYMERNQFYKKLLQENYPYIIKLAPQKECIMKWGNLGFQVL